MPVLTYVGGKKRVLKHILPALPRGPLAGAYVEPFLGGGCVLDAVLRAGVARAGAVRASDVNAPLVSVFQSLKSDPVGLAEAVSDLLVDQSEETYYAVRAEYNRHRDAARFVYLNMTCFNGVYRENARGEFNVPWGRRGRKKPARVDGAEYAAAGELYQRWDVQFAACDWEAAVAGVGAGDLVYLDPPYVKVRAQGFTTYVADDFDAAANGRLLDWAASARARGAAVMYSNHDADAVLSKLGGWRVQRFTVRHSVRASADHENEILATTY